MNVDRFLVLSRDGMSVLAWHKGLVAFVPLVEVDEKSIIRPPSARAARAMALIYNGVVTTEED